MAAEFDGVEMRGVSHPKNANELVLAPVEAALASVGFHPCDKIEHGAIGRAAGCYQLADVTPIHAYKMHGAID
jgi:hypothetical protein